MDLIKLHDPASGASARIAPNLGFNCFEFRTAALGRTCDVIDAAPDFLEGKHRPSLHGIPLLFPFPNRIRNGRYTWNGRDYELNQTGVSFDAAGNAIHGFCLDQPWRIASVSEQSVTATFQLSLDAPDRRELWPADFLIAVRYSLSGATLRADIRIENPDVEPLPWGFGTHPYFRLPLTAESQLEQCLVEIPAAEEWELIDCLPTGKRRPVPPEKDMREGALFQSLKLDDVLTNLQARAGVVETLIMDQTAGLQILQRFPTDFREVVAFTPSERAAVCIEPYTCLTDAINLAAENVDAGLRVLEPGGRFETWIEITAGPVIV